MKFLKASALIVFMAVGVFICWFIVKAGRFLDATNTQTTSALTQLNAALTTINHPCVPGPCGTLAKIDQTMNESDSLIAASNRTVLDADQVEKTELAMLPVWNSRVTSTFDNADATLSSLNGTALQASASLKGISDGVIRVLAHTDATVSHVDALTQSPQVTQTLQNVDSSTAKLADSMAHADAILANVQKETDAYVKAHPKCRGFWSCLF